MRSKSTWWHGLALAVLFGASGCQAVAPAAVAPAEAALPLDVPTVPLPLGPAGETRMTFEVTNGLEEHVRVTGAGEAALLNGYGQQVYRASEGKPWRGTLPAGTYTLVLTGPAGSELGLQRGSWGQALLNYAEAEPPFDRGGTAFESRDEAKKALFEAAEAIYGINSYLWPYKSLRIMLMDMTTARFLERDYERTYELLLAAAYNARTRDPQIVISAYRAFWRATPKHMGYPENLYCRGTSGPVYPPPLRLTPAGVRCIEQ